MNAIECATLLSLKRSGSFDATPSMIPNNHKCAAMATVIYNYTVEIHALGDQLTPEGYVLNNENVQEFFDNTYGKDAKPWQAISCERLSLNCARQFADLVQSKGAYPIRVCVTIEGSNGALITGQWWNESEKAQQVQKYLA